MGESQGKSQLVLRMDFEMILDLNILNNVDIQFKVGRRNMSVADEVKIFFNESMLLSRIE